MSVTLITGLVGAAATGILFWLWRREVRERKAAEHRAQQARDAYRLSEKQRIGAQAAAKAHEHQYLAIHNALHDVRDKLNANRAATDEALQNDDAQALADALNKILRG